MIKERIVNLGNFEFYDGYFIGRMDEGVNTGKEFTEVITNLIQKYFSGQPAIYISDQVHSYSHDPYTLIHLAPHNNVRHIAYVTYTPLQKSSFLFERSLMEDIEQLKGTQLCHFESLDAAIVWAEQILQEKPR